VHQILAVYIDVQEPTFLTRRTLWIFQYLKTTSLRLPYSLRSLNMKYLYTFFWTSIMSLKNILSNEF
jgi:hypothetical protein